MNKALIDETRQLSDKALAEILFHALFALASRDAATRDQVQIMLELQIYLNPCLKVA